MPRKILVHPEEAGLTVPADRADHNRIDRRLGCSNSRSIGLSQDTLVSVFRQVVPAAFVGSRIESTTCVNIRSASWSLGLTFTVHTTRVFSAR
jgi:hypothetical protein